MTSAFRNKDFARHVGYWSDLSASDPHYAILTAPGKQHNRWNDEEFYANGEQEIEALMRTLDGLRVPAERRRALDFGCGLGRLTFPLSRKFDRVDGVDVAPEMIRRARLHPTSDGRCEFLCHPSPDLACYRDASFDLVLSMITLQHMRARFIRRYLAEFARVLRPGGGLVFQLFFAENPAHPIHEIVARLRPSRAVRWYKLVRRVIMFDWKRPDVPRMEMHGMAPWDVTRELTRLGLAIVRVSEDDKCGPEWLSYTYVCRRSAQPLPLRARISTR